MNEMFNRAATSRAEQAADLRGSRALGRVLVRPRSQLGGARARAGLVLREGGARPGEGSCRTRRRRRDAARFRINA